MSCIPLIFARPFQSIHFSLGNIAYTCLYASPLTTSIGTLSSACSPPVSLGTASSPSVPLARVCLDGQRRSHRKRLLEDVQGSCLKK